MDFTRTIVITLRPESTDFITLQTYAPRFGKSERFFVHRAELERLAGEFPALPLIDSDLNNFLHVYRDKNHLSVRATWLSVSSSDRAAGYVQRFTLPVQSVRQALAGTIVKTLFHTGDTKPKATIRFTPEGHREIRRLCADKYTRRALCRFFRDNMNYGEDETIELTRDGWAKGFYFVSPETGLDGGIILHETEIRGKDGKAHRKVFFGLHT